MTPVRILCTGAGHMGRSHALAYHQLEGFEICGLVTRSPEGREKLNREFGSDYPGFSDFYEALAATKPDAVSISTYIETHAPFALATYNSSEQNVLQAIRVSYIVHKIFEELLVLTYSA